MVGGKKLWEGKKKKWRRAKRGRAGIVNFEPINVSKRGGGESFIERSGRGSPSEYDQKVGTAKPIGRNGGVKRKREGEMLQTRPPLRARTRE